MPDSSDYAYEAFVQKASSPHREKLVELVDSISRAFPELERLIAWNIVHFRLGSDYVLGIDVLKKALWLHPFQEQVLVEFRDRLNGYHVTRKSFQIPLDQDTDFALVNDIIAWCVKRVP